MKKALLLFALLCSGAIFANDLSETSELKPGTISGKVVDQTNHEPVPYATIVVKNGAGTETITGSITTDEGTFEINDLPEGPLKVEVQFIGYKTFSKAIVIDKAHKKIDLGTIELQEEAQALNEVEVVAERTTIEQKVDRKVINVGKDLTTAGATAGDIMNNIPSLNVDQQTGDLSLRGNSNVRVMVDGKLSNVPVAQLLKQIPSTSIKSIELITNPSAKYNPEGMSGIINIVLYKNTNIGLNGNINLGLTKGYYAKFNNSMDLNYRNGKWNLYGSYGTNIGKNNNRGHLERLDQNSDQFIHNINNGKSYLYKFGVDFYLDDNNTFSVFTNQNLYNGKQDGNTKVMYQTDPARDLEQQLFSEEDNHSQQYNFVYKHDFAKEGHNIELEADYNRFTNDEDADFMNSGAIVVPSYMDFVDGKRDQFTANLDYVNPLDSISKLELGLESRNYTNEVGYQSTGLTYNEQGVLRPTPATDFSYGMDIYSAYATFGQKRPKWSYQVGVRAETVTVKADTNTVRSFTDKYTQLYPSAFLTYSLNEKNQLQLSYSRRVDRPGLNQVNPIRQWSSPIFSNYGNPELVPQFTDSYELNHTKRMKNGSITAGVFYRHISDQINRAIYVDRLDFNKSILTYDNFDDTSSYGLELSANYRPYKWWNVNGSFDMYSQTQRGRTESFPIGDENATVDDITILNSEVTNTAWNVRLNQSFSVTKKLNLQLFGFYRGENQNLQFTIKPMYFVNTGARYSFAQGKGSLSLNFNDIFNTMRFAVHGDYPYEQEGKFKWESRNVYVGMSYMFGDNKAKRVKRKDRDRDDGGSGGGGGIL